MIADASGFRPLVLRRLVPAGPGVELNGPGTLFRAGELVDESGADEAPARGTLVQLADRRR